MAEIAFEKLRELGEHITACNFCAACNRPNSGIEWCRLCSPHKNLSTGNSEIDEILYSRQIHAKNCDEIIEYVPHSDFKDIRQIGQGGFAFIYTATWEKKTPQEVSIPVVLKKSKNPIHEFIGGGDVKDPPDTTIHSEAFYTSRHLPVQNLSKLSNSGSNNFSQDSFPDSKLEQLSIPKSYSK
ncbi:15936_t:CDS:2 [Rhizophagus irregularis]|nr:15936_t:CDS:2 [Rhizophagus irregularis]